MRVLTQKILEEEAEKYFPKMGYSFSLRAQDSNVDAVLPVFPGYMERQKKGLRDNFELDHRITPFMMDDYIRGCLDLAKHMMLNDYPLRQILAVLPSQFASRVAERVKKERRIK